MQYVDMPLLSLLPTIDDITDDLISTHTAETLTGVILTVSLSTLM